MKNFRVFGLLNLLIIVFIICCNIKVKAQTDYEDFTFEKRAIKERKAVPYPSLVERDVAWSRRIYRIIDTREKMNLPMKWPRNPLHKIIYEAVTSGYGSAPIPAYRNDSLLTTYTAEEVLSRGGTTEIVQVAPDPINNPDFTIDSTITNPFRHEEIIRYKIVEDWIFDRQRSMFYVRIIAIAPLFHLKVAGQDLGEQELFWVKWDDFRRVCVNQEIFNRHNDAMRLSYDDFFEQRMFSSYIIKEPNAFDNEIGEFEEFKADPFAALLQSEKIKDRLFEFEHNLWLY